MKFYLYPMLSMQNSLPMLPGEVFQEFPAGPAQYIVQFNRSSAMVQARIVKSDNTIDLKYVTARLCPITGDHDLKKITGYVMVRILPRIADPKSDDAKILKRLWIEQKHNASLSGAVQKPQQYKKKWKK